MKKTNLKRLSALSAGTMLLTAFVGCGKEPTQQDSGSNDSSGEASGTVASPQSDNSDIKVGFVVKSLSDSFYVLMKAGAEAEAEKTGLFVPEGCQMMNRLFQQEAQA